jgi:hypothetical protein
MPNTIIYAEEWATKLQERLSEPVKWKNIANVIYTNTRVLHNPYLTEMTVQTGTRGSGYTPQDVTITDESVTISTYKIAPQVIDRADLAQTTFVDQMVLADKQGVLLNEAIESALYANHAARTDFGDTGGGVLGLAATQITVSATNIDDIIRAVKREIRKAGGQALLNRNGGFIVWRPADLELLEGFMQANGFTTADRGLDGGGALDAAGEQGIQYMGLTHYSSNLLTASHVYGGVKRCETIGIVKDTYGQVVVTQDPVVSSAQISGIGVISRVDYAVKVWNNQKPVLFDINVA